jgi:hypothetical protein
MEWQKFALIHSHKVKADGRWATPQNIFCVARQNGKSFLQQIRILGGLFLWDEPLQIGQAHTLNTSLEQFRQMMWTIEANDFLAKQVKKVRLNHGAEEIETMKGTRFMVRAGGSAARGISRPSTIHLDELLRMNNMDSYASVAVHPHGVAQPNAHGLFNAGDNTSVVLNSLEIERWQLLAALRTTLGILSGRRQQMKSR